MVACERCWADSQQQAFMRGVDSVDEYERLVKERECTPEQQAGPDAAKCDPCERMTVHQHAKICVLCGREG